MARTEDYLQTLAAQFDCVKLELKYEKSEHLKCKSALKEALRQLEKLKRNNLELRLRRQGYLAEFDDASSLQRSGLTTDSWQQEAIPWGGYVLNRSTAASSSDVNAWSTWQGVASRVISPAVRVNATSTTNIDNRPTPSSLAAWFLLPDVILDRRGGAKLGIHIDHGDNVTLFIKSIDHAGLMSEWNRTHRYKEILVGDRIVAANGIRGDAIDIFNECQSTSIIWLKIERYTSGDPRQTSGSH